MNSRTNMHKVDDLSESRRVLQSRDFAVPDFAQGLRILAKEAQLELPNITGMAERVLFLVNGPAHLARRKAWMEFFRSENIRHWEPALQALAAEQVAGLPGSGEVDLVPALAVPMVSLANCRLLGVPEANHQEYNAWAAEIASLVESVLSIRRARRAEHLAALFAADLHARLPNPTQQRNPTPSVFEFLGQSLPKDAGEMERTWTLMALYMTGLATLFTFSNVLLNIARSPPDYRRMLLDPDSGPAAFDDLIGRSGAVLYMHRIARKPTEINGIPVDAGDTVAARTVDPNLAPAAGECPFSSLHSRSPETETGTGTGPTQMPFGTGLHRCIGEDFARRVMRHGVTALLKRFPEFRLAEPPDPSGPLPNIRGPDALRCVLRDS